jgi:hypothetical protein
VVGGGRRRNVWMLPGAALPFFTFKFFINWDYPSSRSATMVAPVVKALTDLLMSWAASDEVDEEHLRLPIPQNCHEDCSSFGFLTSPSVLTHFGLPIDIMRVGENAERPWSEEDQKAIGAYLTHLYRLYRKDHHKYASAFEGADASPQAQGSRAWRLKITAAWNNVDGTRKLKAVLKAHGLDLDTLVMMHAVVRFFLLFFPMMRTHLSRYSCQIRLDSVGRRTLKRLRLRSSAKMPCHRQTHHRSGPLLRPSSSGN